MESLRAGWMTRTGVILVVSGWLGGLSLASADVAALIASGRQHFEAGEYEAAAADFSQALAQDGSSAEAMCGLGATYLQQGKLDEARPLLTRAVEAKPSLTEAHLNLGACLLEMGAPQAAAAEFQKAVELEPDSPVAYFNLGAAYLRLSKWTEAVNSLSTAYRKGVQSAEVHYGLSIAYVATGNLEEAARQLEAAVLKSPQNADYFVALGRAYLQLKQGSRAVAALRKAISLQPYSQAAWEELPGALEASGDPATLLEQLVKKAEAASDDLLAQCEAGLFAVHLNKYEPAEKCLRRAVELDPQHPVAQSALGWALVLQEKWAEAVAPLAAAAKLLPGDIPVLVNLALAYFNSDQTEAYEQTLRDILALDKYHYEAAMSLGNLLSNRSEWEEAARAYERAASGRQTKEAFLRAGECRLAAGQPKAAVPLLQKAATMEGSDPEAYFALGRAEEAAGDVKAARRAYEKVLAISPDHKQAQERLAHLPAS